MDEGTKKGLTALLGDRVRFDEPMIRHTHFRVGGPADALASPRSIEELAALVRRCAETRIPYRVIGGGTNLLVTDGGIRGLVIRLGRGLDAIVPVETSDATPLVKAMAGAGLRTLCRFAAENGLAGMNFAAGIPGTVGGGLMMNAGTASGCMGDVTRSITVMNPEGRTRTIPRRDLNFAYRHLTWGPSESEGPGLEPIVVDGTFRLRPADASVLKTRARDLLRQRAQNQPVDLPSAGCFFKNPAAGKTAGELIDLAGLKGCRVGQAQVSEKHANYIVNLGGASAADILNLGRRVRQAVADKFNIQLEFEVKIVGT